MQMACPGSHCGREELETEEMVILAEELELETGQQQSFQTD